MSEPATGATPGTGATPAHRYPHGPAWAAYRLPIGAGGLITAREAGVLFDGESDGDGATPPASGQPPATTPAPTANPPATGEPQPDADGMTTDAGRRALAAERKRAGELQKRVEELEGQTATDSEKAIKAAKAEAARERDDHWSARIRRSEARAALRVAGVTNEKDLELAANAPVFEALTVGDDGTIKDLAAVVETFKKDHPAMFTPAAGTPPAAGGDVTRGPQNGAPPSQPKGLHEAVAAALGPR